MRMFVVRHGESENNISALWSGWSDVNLTQKGYEDAQKVGEMLKNIKFDRVYSSDLKRAVETAKTALPGCDCHQSRLLREVNVGNIAGSPYSCISYEKRVYASKYGYGEFGGESREEFRNRLISFIKEIEKEDFENVILFSHAGVLTEMLSIVTDSEFTKRKIKCTNCAYMIAEYADNEWKLHSWNNLI